MQAGVVQLSSTNTLPAAQLKAKYLELLKQQGRSFGYIVRSMAPPAALAGTNTDIQELLALISSGGQGAAAGPTGPLIPQIIRVTPDGAEEVVRGMRFGALAPTLFREVLGASAERELLNIRGTPGQSPGPGALGSRQVPVSVIAPALIVDDLEIQPHARCGVEAARGAIAYRACSAAMNARRVSRVIAAYSSICAVRSCG